MEREIVAEYEINEIDDTLHGSVGSRLTLFARELKWRSSSWHGSSALRLPTNCYGGRFVIDPNGRWYRMWSNMMFLWSIYSVFYTPFAFCFFRGLPEHLLDLECAQLIFLADVAVHFFLAYRDPHTHRVVYDKQRIALRYIKGSFALDMLGCFPWDAIYKFTGRMEMVRYLVWLRLYRARKIQGFFKKMEKDIRISYLFTRIVKLVTVELYCTHTAACIFYYLATTLPPAHEGGTWIGSLTMGDRSYSNFRHVDLLTRYITSLYLAIVTMATVGYGDIHAVNTREMVFIVVYVSFDMLLGAYLIGNMTALIVKGSRTERFRDKMTELTRYMNRNKLGSDIRSQVKAHLVLQYESSYRRDRIIDDDIPVAIRSKTLYMDIVSKVHLFKGCSEDFLSQIVVKLHEEFFLPGEVILEQGTVVDQIYIVAHGCLEEIGIGEGESEMIISELLPYDIVGDVAVICNTPQPYTIRVCELCRLLRIDKQSLTSILQMYFKDSRQIMSNLLKGKRTESKGKQLESNITYLIAKQEADQVIGVNNAAYHGDLFRLKGLIRAGADPSKPDYDGRTALHVAASRGYEDIIRVLIQRGANVNSIDKFGNSPLLTAVKCGHDRIISLLVAHGAALNLEDAGGYLCRVVAEGKIDLLRRLLRFGVDPNCRNYDRRTPLHVAAGDGLPLVASMLVELGADVMARDRWGNTPLDEARRCSSKPLIRILEQARAAVAADQ
ncbi:potassium channel KOR2-like [Lolium rigidum]|uniref:potassium channel KOR2-like n=1 Tax=Lolium rigidum TaxID=89674 RepID=UPI001F5C843B|nr:potassium channel KOR2-like [Lolium rigidum]